MAVSVEDVSSSVVREYLSRKGLKRTIACMDEEHPRTESSINNRSHLRQILNIEGLYKKNKAQTSPLKTLLEIIVKHLIEDLKNHKITNRESGPLLSAKVMNLIADSPSEIERNDTKTDSSTTASVMRKHVKLRSDVAETCPSQPIHTLYLPETDRLSSGQNQTAFWALESGDEKSRPLMTSLQNNESVIRREPEKKMTESTHRSRANRIRRGMMAGPIASTPHESNKKRQNRRVEVPHQLLRKEEENKQSWDGLSVTGSHQKSSESGLTEFSSADCEEVQWEFGTAPEKENSFEKLRQDRLKITKVKSLTRPNVADLDVSEMVLDDIDEDEDVQELSRVSFQRTVQEHSYAGHGIDVHTAKDLKAVLLGPGLNCFSIEWRNQGFTFSETHDLRYGIVQKKGGPCGVLASVQAFVLKKLLFENNESTNTGLQRLRPSNMSTRKCLVLAAAEILWRAGEEKQATVAINSGRNHFIPTGQYKSEGVLEKITCFTVGNIQDLQLLLERHIDQFETGGLGCILLTISAVLSRSIEKVKEDMDVPTTTLIGAHGYCTQELVNLLLCGKAVSNVFDDDMELDSGNGNTTLLKGIKGHCDVGLLSLFEHYNICKVGAYLKTPRYPVWVVCSESHFSVLFGLQRELLTTEDTDLEFDLYYYDGLANQQEEIRLTVSAGKSSLSCQDDDTDLIPPLDLCIRTRWKDASINWNDTEPIL